MPRNRPRESNPANARPVAISKALSYVLRHAAEREGLKIDAQGYANVADVVCIIITRYGLLMESADNTSVGVQLAWRKLKSLQTTFPEIIDAVATSDKKRFALLHVPSETERTAITEGTPELCFKEQEDTDVQGQDQNQENNATEKALAVTDHEPSNFLIRATQGHSIKSVKAEALLEKLSLTDDESKLPTTVVHGTFHTAWLGILASGGLRCMGRNHVHFATGPSLDSIIPRQTEGTETESTAQGLKDLGLNEGQVISGMRRDAQVLIYIDLKKALAAGCPFWRSENNVILSEGMELATKNEDSKIVPLEFVSVVVERKHGLGKIWEDGKVLQELPTKLTQHGTPKGKRGKK